MSRNPMHPSSASAVSVLQTTVRVLGLETGCGCPRRSRNFECTPAVGTYPKKNHPGTVLVVLKYAAGQAVASTSKTRLQKNPSHD